MATFNSDKVDNKKIGQFGENLACQYLVKNGYHVLDRNFAYYSKSGKKLGEIDIIAKKKKEIVFVEVKTQKFSGSFHPEDKVNYKKLQRIKKLAEIWLEKHKLAAPFSVDIITLSLDFQQRKAKITHFKNV